MAASRLVLAGLLLCSLASAQMNKTDKILLGGLMTLNAADAGLTIHNITLGGQIESNPFARPLVTHGPELADGFFAATTLTDMFIVRKLERHHPKLARLYLIGGIALEASCVRIGVKNLR